MNKIIKIHGCSGAGKTTAVRYLIARAKSIEPFELKSLTVKGHKLILEDVRDPVYLIGRYDVPGCGGVDTISDFRNVLGAIDHLHPWGHIVFEGLLQSTYYGTMGKHSQQFGAAYKYVFLDTPAEVCLERVVARRYERGTKSKFNPQNTLDKHETIRLLHLKLLGPEYPHDDCVLQLKWDEDMYDQIVRILQS